MAPAAYPHTQAVKALLTAAGLTVGIGHRPPGSGRQPDGSFRAYLILWPGPGWVVDGDVLAALGTDLNVDWQVTAVGSGPEQAQDYADRARTALVGVTPVVTGRVCRRITQTDPGPGLQRDDDVDPPVYYQPVRYAYRSTPA